VEHLPGSSEDESDSWDEDGGDEEFGGKKKNRPEKLEVGNFSLNTALLLLTKDISFPQKVFVPEIRSDHEEPNWTWDRMLSFCNGQRMPHNSCCMSQGHSRQFLLKPPIAQGDQGCED
jgi:hypothetical protein